MIEIPADVRAAADVVARELCCGGKCDCVGGPEYPQLVKGAKIATAAIAASDRVRMQTAGYVAERLGAVANGKPAPDLPGLIRAAFAVVLTLRAALSEAQAERDAARVTALREAAATVRRLELSGEYSAAEAHGRMAQALAGAAAILALIPTETTDA